MKKTIAWLLSLALVVCVAGRAPAEDYGASLDGLVTNLGAEDVGQRLNAVNALDRLCGAATVPGAEAERAALCQAVAAKLGQGNPTAKVFLLRVLERYGRNEGVEAAAGLLGSDDVNVRESARRALERITSKDAGQALVKALVSANDAKWRISLIHALGNRDDADLATPLIKELGGDNEEVRAAAAKALGKLGNKAAAEPLSAAMGKGTPKTQATFSDAYLMLGDRLCQKDDKASALAIYKKLADAKGHLKCAAIVGLGRAGGAAELNTIFGLMENAEPDVRGACVFALSLMTSEDAIKAMLEKYKTVTPEMKVVLLRALTAIGSKLAAPTMVAALADADENLRTAAARGLGAAGDGPSMAALAKTASAGGALGNVARQSLDSLPGKDIDQALMDLLKSQDAKVRAEAARTLAARKVIAAAPALLKAAEDAEREVRGSAFKALAVMGGEDSLPPLAGLLVRIEDDGERDAAADAAVSIAKRMDVPEKAAEPFLSVIANASPAGKVGLLKVLGMLGGPKAMDEMRKALKSNDEKVVEGAVRGLSAWPDDSAAAELLAVVKGSTVEKNQVLAMRGFVRVVGLPSKRSDADTLKLYQDAMALTKRPDEKRLVLGGLGTVRHPDALVMAMSFIDDAALQQEACAAAAQVGGLLGSGYEAAVRPAIEKVLQVCKVPKVVKMAQEVISALDRTKGFLTNWEVSGPCTQEGKDGGAVFDVVFPAEKPDAPAGTWKALKEGMDKEHPEMVDFMRTSMAGDNRAVYLRTRVSSPKALPGRFEVSSDDGIKIWLNGKIVHSKNVMRGMDDVDKGDIELKEGWNDVMVKVTQGGGGWSVRVRFVSRDGQALSGLKIDPAGK